MSLVNDMLRDLEQRNEGASQLPGQKNTVKAAQPASGSTDQIDTGNKARAVLWFIGISALILTGWFLWQDQMVKEAPNLATAVPASSINKAPAEAVIAPPVAVIESRPVVQGNEVTRIQWNEKEDGGDLVVTLSQSSDVQLISQQEESISLALNKTKLGTEIPLIDSSLIKRLDMIRETDRILINLLANSPSRFVFSVQQDPAALIVGVQPTGSIVSKTTKASKTTKPIVAKVEAEPEPEPEPELKPIVAVVEGAKAEQMPVISSSLVKQGTSLQVNAEQKSDAKPTQPVIKVKNSLTEAQQLNRARRLLKQGQTAAAVELLRQQITEQPEKSLSSRQLLASILLNSGNQGDADTLLQASLQRHPQDVLLKKLFARTLLAKGQSSRGVQLLTTNQPLLSKDSEYYELLASAYQQAGQPEQSASVYYQLLQVDSNQPRWWVGLGYALEQAQRYQEARKAYQSGLQVPSIDSQLKNYARQRSNALAGH